VTRPLVSVCVPTWNRAAALRDSLKTIQGQDYAPLEIVISDNGSTDGTEALCRAVAAEDTRVRYFRHPDNIGLYQNHNFLIDVSRGEFIAFFHDHDTRALDVVSKFVRFMEEHRDVGVVSSDWDVLSRDGKVLAAREHAVAAVTPGLEFIERTIRVGRSSVGVPGALIRRSALGDIRFDEARPLGFGDFVVWFQIAEQWSIGHLSERLWGWTQEPDAQSVRRIVSLIHDYDLNLNAYCDGFLTRRPDEQARVDRWRRLIRRYIFWALAFEIGLHHRGPQGDTTGATLFEMLPYRLSQQEFDTAVSQLALYRTGLDQSAVWFTLSVLLRLRFTWPLAWVTRHYASMRMILGLR
jgi:glycosyltransferase involved in cell wall biosynthesis